MNVCLLCVAPQTERVLWCDSQCYVIDADDPDYPGFSRVIWRTHVREMSDLTLAERTHVMTVVHGVEVSLRALLQPVKINLASFGNQVPHLHWHVIPRFADDPHFPDAVWAARRRTGERRVLNLSALREEIVRQLGRSA